MASDPRHIFIAFPSGHPVTRSSFLNTREAERAAARLLGADWKKRGYRIGYGPFPKEEPSRGPRGGHRMKGEYSGRKGLWESLIWRTWTSNGITWDPFAK